VGYYLVVDGYTMERRNNPKCEFLDEKAPMDIFTYFVDLQSTTPLQPKWKGVTTQNVRPLTELLRVIITRLMNL
jgi:hypothetical protein